MLKGVRKLSEKIESMANNIMVAINNPKFPLVNMSLM